MSAAAATRRFRALGLFDHEGVRRLQNLRPEAERVPGPYRIDFLLDEGIDLIPLTPARGRAHRKVRDVIEHRTGVRVDLAMRGLGWAARADAVLCMLEDKAVLPAALRRRRMPPYARVPIAVVSCWWAEEIAHGSAVARQRIARTVAEVDRVFVFSRNQAAVFAQIGAGDKVVPVSFGVDETWYTPGTPQRTRMQVAAMGIDRGRDFETLVEAARLTPEIRYDIFTQPGRITATPPNVTLHPPTTMAEHRDNLRAADLIVVPTHDLAYPTGQSVLLEAMACGRCVAVTHTEAMSEYIDDGRTNLALPMHDPAGVARVITQAIQDPALRDRIGAAARTEVETRFSFRRTWRDVGDALRTLRRR